MQLSSHSNQANVRRTAVAVLTLLMAASSAGQIACAQAMDGSGFAPLSNEQDSLLPPEVVPLDPSAANSMTAAQAANRQAQTSDPGSVPGLVSNANKNGTISARDFRRDALDSMYNQNPSAMQQQQQQQWQGAGMGNNQGQTPGMNSQMGSPYGSQPPYTGQVDMANANAQPAQSQTLSGGSNKQQTIQNTNRGGFTNNASGVTTGALGAFSFLYRANPMNALMSVGMWGLMLNGFGNRNGFRL